MERDGKINLPASDKCKWPAKTLKALNTFRKSDQTLCDVFLSGKDSRPAIPAHRCVLAANSVYFHAMFTSGLAESRQDHREVRIQGVDTELLALIVDFLYVGSCRIADEDIYRILDLLAASTMLQVDQLSQTCCVHLEKCLDISNALEFWLFAERHGLTGFALPCREFVQMYFGVISRSEQFLELDAHNMATCLALKEISMGNSSTEDLVAMGVLRWLQHDPRTRLEDYGRVLKEICWEQVSIETKELFRAQLEELHKKWKTDNGGDEVESPPHPDSMLQSTKDHRQFFASIIIIGGLQNSRAQCLSKSSHTRVVEVVHIDVATGKVIRRWENHLRRPFTSPKCCLRYRGLIYMFYFQSKKNPDVGDCANSFCLDTMNVVNGKFLSQNVQENDTESVWWDLADKWTYVRAVDEDRGFIYLCGCLIRKEGVSQKRVFKLDMEKNKCTELASLPFARSHHRAICVEGTLYVLGGVDWRLTPLSTVLKYNPVESVWEEVSPMNQPRIDGAFVTVDGRIYATGGSTSKERSREVEVYNPALDIWTPLCPMTVPRVNHGLVSVAGYLFAIGGQSYSGEDGGARNVQRTVERYNIAQDHWKKVWNMESCRWGMMACTI